MTNMCKFRAFIFSLLLLLNSTVLPVYMYLSFIYQSTTCIKAQVQRAFKQPRALNCIITLSSIARAISAHKVSFIYPHNC